MRKFLSSANYNHLIMVMARMYSRPAVSLDSSPLNSRLASHSLFSDWTGEGEKGLVTLGYSLCKSGMLLMSRANYPIYSDVSKAKDTQKTSIQIYLASLLIL